MVVLDSRQSVCGIVSAQCDANTAEKRIQSQVFFLSCRPFRCFSAPRLAKEVNSRWLLWSRGHCCPFFFLKTRHHRHQKCLLLRIGFYAIHIIYLSICRELCDSWTCARKNQKRNSQLGSQTRTRITGLVQRSARLQRQVFVSIKQQFSRMVSHTIWPKMITDLKWCSLNVFELILKPVCISVF